MNTAQVNFSVEDNTISVTPAQAGLNAVLADLKRGPYLDPSTVFSSWPQFKEVYGGLDPDKPDTYHIKRALERGSKLRVCRVGESDGSGGVTASKATQDTVIQTAAPNATELFELPLKYKGAEYNSVVTSIKAPSNGQTGYFDIEINFPTSDGETITELYQNILIDALYTVAESNYLQEIVEESKLVDVVYKDLSSASISVPAAPEVATISYSGGSDGAGPVAADYTAAISKFEDYDDFWHIAAPEIYDNSFNVALAAYGQLNKVWPLLYLGANSDKTVLEGRRDALNLDSQYGFIYAGDHVIVNELTTGPTELVLSGCGDILGAAGSTDAGLGPWRSFTGPNRGVFIGTKGIGTTNYGTKARKGQLNDLANRQINMIINKGGKTMIWDSYTPQLKSSQLSFISISKLVGYLERSLGPTIEDFLQDPTDLVLFRKMYKVVRPFLSDLTTKEKRALTSFLWQGDQDAATLDNLSINDPAKVSLGKYKVILNVKAIAPLVEVDVVISLTPQGVSFEVAA